MQPKGAFWRAGAISGTIRGWSRERGRQLVEIKPPGVAIGELQALGGCPSDLTKKTARCSFPAPPPPLPPTPPSLVNNKLQSSSLSK